MIFTPRDKEEVPFQITREEAKYRLDVPVPIDGRSFSMRGVPVPIDGRSFSMRGYPRKIVYRIKRDKVTALKLARLRAWANRLTKEDAISSIREDLVGHALAPAIRLAFFQLVLCVLMTIHAPLVFVLAGVPWGLTLVMMSVFHSRWAALVAAVWSALGLLCGLLWLMILARMEAAGGAGAVVGLVVGGAFAVVVGGGFCFVYAQAFLLCSRAMRFGSWR
jgi:hypothetical protein